MGCPKPESSFLCLEPPSLSSGLSNLADSPCWWWWLLCPDLSPAQGAMAQGHVQSWWWNPRVWPLVLSRKPEASLHLHTGKREGKAPHCPLSHTEALLLMEGQEWICISCSHLLWLSHTPWPCSWPPPGQGCTVPAGKGEGWVSQQLPRVHVSSQHSSRSSSNLCDLSGWMAANCHHCILSRPWLQSQGSVTTGGVKRGKKRKRKQKEKTTCLAGLTAFGWSDFRHLLRHSMPIYHNQLRAQGQC